MLGVDDPLAPALAPYLVGLLVLLGMLGTFLGMVVTFKGAVFALEGSTDLQAIRSNLEAVRERVGSDRLVLAAVKAVPLGQASGQRMFRRLQEPVRTAAQESLRRAGSGRLSSWMPGLAIASARHETQYTRLFRS